MRRWLIRLLFVAILPFSMAAAASGDKKLKEPKWLYPDGETPQVITQATLSDPKTFNLMVSDEASSGDVVGELWEGLTQRNPRTGEIEPLMAESWEHSEDGLSWTFHLRRDVKWSDGHPFTAEDLVFTFDVIYHPKVITSYKDSFTIEGAPVVATFADDKPLELLESGAAVKVEAKRLTGDQVEFTLRAGEESWQAVVENAEAARTVAGFEVSRIKAEALDNRQVRFTVYARLRVEMVDKYTVKFTLPVPFAPFLSAAGVMVLPKHVLARHLEAGTFSTIWGVDTPGEQLVGTGPYQLTKYVPAQYARYRRNPYYWKKDDKGGALPYLAEKTLLIVQDLNTMYLKFRNGEFDLYSPRGENVKDLEKEAEKLDIHLQELGVPLGAPFLGFNRNTEHYRKDGKTDPRYRWFTDKQFLRAIAHSIDKEGIINLTMNGYGEPAVGEISPSMPLYHHPGLKDYEYDLDLAAEILDKAGYKDRDGDGILEDADGNKVEFNLYTNSGNNIREKICTIIQEDLRRLGIKVNYKPLEFNSLVEKLVSNYDWDAIVLSFTGASDPHFGSNVLRSSGKLHFWHPRQKYPATEWEAEIDRLMMAGARELDQKKRSAIYRRVQEILHEELPMILTVRQITFRAWKKKVKNYYPSVLGTYRPERIMIAP